MRELPLTCIHLAAIEGGVGALALASLPDLASRLGVLVGDLVTPADGWRRGWTRRLGLVGEAGCADPRLSLSEHVSIARGEGEVSSWAPRCGPEAQP